MLDLLSYPPILRAVAAIVLAGVLLPQAGMAVIRLNLIPLRFMLIHGLLLGGALGLAMGWSPVWISLAMNLLLVFCLVWFTRRSRGNYGYMSALFMALSAALAAWIIYRFKVPARESMTILWGSPFTISPVELAVLAGLTVILLFLRIKLHRPLSLLFFDRELAKSGGLSEGLYHWGLVMVLAVLVSLAMKLLGALLLDLLLLLPVLAVSWLNQSFRRSTWLVSIFGLIAGLGGSLSALAMDTPLSTGITLVMIPLLGISALLGWRASYKTKRFSEAHIGSKS